MATSNYGTKKKKIDKAVVDVPEDLIVQILSRVPVRSLFQLRWACKYWYNLITSDPSFIKLHLQHLNQISHSNQISVLISDKHNKILLVNRIHGNRVSIPIRERKLFPYRIWGSSCNGLFCVEMLKLHAICLWNPCTNELMTIPNSLLPTKDAEYSLQITYGLGYCPNIDDYIVIKRTTRYIFGSLEIYSLRTNSWKLLYNGDNPYHFFFHWMYGVGLHLNGSLYLPLRRPGCVCFDIEKEEYRQLSLPINGTVSRGMKFGECQGCLCMLIGMSDAEDVEVWMTKDCGRTKENWVKSFTITNPMVKEILMCKYRYTPTKFNENGEILLRHEKDSKLFWYNPKSDQATHISEFPSSWSEVETYTETLVSPKVLKYMC